MQGNGLTGTLASSPPWVSSLTLIDLHSNQLSGPLPNVTSSQSPSIRKLYLGGNVHLNGSLPVSWATLTTLSALSSAGSKGLSGGLPAEYSNLTALTLLDFSGCSFNSGQKRALDDVRTRSSSPL